jgi:hypothetical protein
MIARGREYLIVESSTLKGACRVADLARLRINSLPPKIIYLIVHK